MKFKHILNSPRRILLVIIGVLGICGSVLYAGNVKITEAITITMTINGQSETFELRGGDFNNFTVETDRIQFSTATEKIKLHGRSSISFGAATDCGTPGKSSIEITENTSVIIVPTRPAEANEEYQNTCEYRVAHGGGGGGTLGVVSPVTPTQPTIQPQVAEKPKDQLEEPTKEPLLKTVLRADSLLDISSLGSTDKKNIIQAVNAMIDNNTYEIPQSRQYGPSKITDLGFGIRISTAVAGLCCSAETEYAGLAKIRGSALDAGLIKTASKSTTQLTRAAFYLMLLKSLGIKLEKSSTKALKQECLDVIKADLTTARVFFTAYKYGIASKYAGNKCRLNMKFSRKEAARWAVRAIKLKLKGGAK